jgi:hypothetical protein
MALNQFGTPRESYAEIRWIEQITSIDFNPHSGLGIPDPGKYACVSVLSGERL